MAYPNNFISLTNFQLAFTRVVRGQNKEYKRLFRHLFPSYDIAMKENLQDLISDIKRGRFEPSGASLVFQPKKSGILRPLRLLSLQDQIVYQSIANTIAETFRAEQDKYAGKRCFGALLNTSKSPFFYKGWKRSYRALDRAMVKAFKAGNNYVADFDLVSFYELIDHKLLREVLERRFKKPEVLDLLFQSLEKWTENYNGSCLHHGIPQGPEPSAFLAECFLFSFDALRFKNVVYLRYVDDIKLMAKDEIPVRRALVKLDIESKQLGLVPQAQKIESRRIENIEELRKTIPSRVASIDASGPASAKDQKQLESMFRKSLKKQKGQWTIVNETKLKFSLYRMNPKASILERIAPILSQRPDLSPVFASYLRKFPQDRKAADAILAALQRDPTYDASAANYIEAMDICEPPTDTAKYRRVIQTAERRSEERGILLKVGAATFRGRRSSPAKALALIEDQVHPLARSLLVHRLFGSDIRAPFKTESGRKLIETETESSDPDLARFCASLLLDMWPWSASTWTSTSNANRSVNLLAQGLGIRAKAPRKVGILDRFFKEKHKIAVKLPWRRALGKDWRDAESRCLRIQKLATGDPSSWVLIVDTFNEVLVKVFSLAHPSTKAAYQKAIPPKKLFPDWGNWLTNPALSKALPKGIDWLNKVHDARLTADLAHAKIRSGDRTKPVTYKKRDWLAKNATIAWAELIVEWKKIL